jgi:hypothetical protein
MPSYYAIGSSVQIERASPLSGSDSAERFLDIILNERLLVGDGLVEHGIRDVGLGCLNAIVQREGQRASTRPSIRLVHLLSRSFHW